MNVMSTLSRTATNLRAVSDEAMNLAQVKTALWRPIETEQLLRLGSAAGEAAAGVRSLATVNFTGSMPTR